MHESNRAKSRLARITEVGKPSPAFTHRQCVLRRQFHEKIVRMLFIDQWLTFIGFPGLKEQRRTSRRKRKWFKTEHAAQLNGTLAQLVIGHRHEPVFRIKFGDAARTTLSIHADDQVVM